MTVSAATIPYGRQSISLDDIQDVVDVLHSDWLTQGPAVERFEGAVAQYTGAAHAVAVCNATAALHLACRALGLKSGDRLWTSPNTFVASANCGLYCGATVDFVDIDPLTYNMSVEALAAKLECAERIGELPKVVVPVHFAGQPCDMAAIAKLARRYGFAVIEDASHAIGSTYRDEKIGACRYSDITIFSFHPVKIVTTGEGGMALTNSPDLAHKMLLLRSHGITRDRECMTTMPEGDWYYQQVDLGFNYRMTDMQAALGASQMRRLEEFVQRRRDLAVRYDRLLGHLDLILPFQREDATSAWHLYVIQVGAENEPPRKVVFDRLRSAGVMVNVHYIPVHLQPYYSRMGFRQGDFPNAEAYYGRAISLPMYFGLTNEQQDRVIGAVEEALQ